MMQLVCNGSRLDLYENTDLQFTEDNPLFAFDKVKCERTTNFKLPATPANDRVFALARIPAYVGEGMRRKFAAQLQLGTIVKGGYLYVSSWNDKEYEAIFVTGEMVGLQAIKDAGKLKDLIQESDRLIWNEANTHGANSAAGRAKYAITRYKTDTALCLPSFDLADIIEDASFGIITPSLQLDKRNWRIIAPKAEPIDERQVTMEFLGTGADPSSDISNPQLARTANISGLSWLGSYASQTILVFVNNAQRYYSVRQFVCGQDIMLTFPEDFSDDIFLMSFGNDAMYNTLKTEYFLGGYSFANNTTTGQGIVRYGTPLAKKSVRINARTPFTFVQASDYDYNRNAPQVEGFRWIGYGNLTATFKAEGIEAREGDYIMLHDILPDITLADALKVYAYLRGRQLYYTDKDGVQFDDLFFISWPRFDISKRLLSIGKVTRTFSDYAQHNLVQFDSADDVPQNTRVITEYTLDNDNISESKEVGEIPFNEGEIDAADGVVVARFDADDVEKNTLPKYGIAVAGQSQFMERIELPKNAGIQALCDASTQVEVQARMSAYEYAQISAKTRILCRGTEYVWTSRSWQKDAAKFVLAKLPLLNTYGLTYETIQTLVAKYGESVVMAVISYVSTRTAIVPYINDNPVIARYVCNIIDPDDSYPYYTTAGVAFPNIISTLQTRVKFGFSQNTASGEIVPLWFGIYGGQNYGYCGYNYNSNPSRLYGFHGNGTSGNFVNLYMASAIPLGSYIMMELSHSFVRAKVGNDEQTTQYTGNWFGNRLAYLYSRTTGTPKLYFSQIFEGDIEQHRLFKMQDGRYWNSIQGRFEQTA